MRRNQKIVEYNSQGQKAQGRGAFRRLRLAEKEGTIGEKQQGRLDRMRDIRQNRQEARQQQQSAPAQQPPMGQDLSEAARPAMPSFENKPQGPSVLPPNWQQNIQTLPYFPENFGGNGSGQAINRPMFTPGMGQQPYNTFDNSNQAWGQLYSQMQVPPQQQQQIQGMYQSVLPQYLQQFGQGMQMQQAPQGMPQQGGGMRPQVMPQTPMGIAALQNQYKAGNMG